MIKVILQWGKVGLSINVPHKLNISVEKPASHRNKKINSRWMNEMNEFLERHKLSKLTPGKKLLQHPCVGADGSLDELGGLRGRGMVYILEVGAVEFADELDMGR